MWNAEDKNKPALLFVHGHAAQSHWWDFIAPAFTKDFRVAAMDLAGHGDSDHQDEYTVLGIANCISAVADQLGTQTTIVGHSFGGTMSRIAAFTQGADLKGLVLVDSLISDSKGARRSHPQAKSKKHHYASIEAAMKRFRLKPPQPKPPAYLLDYISRHSFKAIQGSFSFKLDHHLFSKMAEDIDSDTDISLPDAATMVKKISCPVFQIYGTQSRFFPPESIASLESWLGPDHIFRIDAAHHHLFLDRPVEFTQMLGHVLSKLLK